MCLAYRLAGVSLEDEVMDERNNYDGELVFDTVDEEIAGPNGPDVVCTNHIVTIPAKFQGDLCRGGGELGKRFAARTECCAPDGAPFLRTSRRKPDRGRLLSRPTVAVRATHDRSADLTRPTLLAARLTQRSLRGAYSAVLKSKWPSSRAAADVGTFRGIPPSARTLTNITPSR